MVRRWLLVIAMLLWALPAAAQPVPARIVAVGDLHGDFSAWLDIARDAKLVDPANHWIGGKTVLVQTGDMVDRGADSLKIIRHLQQLDGEAKRAGGRVVVLMGNHEAMQVIGDYRYVTPGEYAAFANRQSKAGCMARCGKTWKFRPSTSSRTTQSASAKTDPRTSPSNNSRACAPFPAS